MYQEAKKANEIFGTPIPASLEKTAKSFEKVAEKTGKASTLIGGIFLPQTYKLLEGLAEANKTADEFGLTFETDVVKALGKAEEAFEMFTSESWKGSKLTKDSQKDLVETILKYYDKLGQEAPEKWKELYKELSTETKKGTVNIVAELEKLGQFIDILGSEVGGQFGEIISTVGVGLQQAIQSIQNGVSGLGNILGSIAPMLGKLGGQIGQFISGAKNSFASLGSSIGSTIGGIFGPLGKAIGSLAGGLLGGLFKKKPKKTEEQRLAEQLQMQVEEAKRSMSAFGISSSLP